MQKVEIKNFGNPDEVRKFPNGRIELVKIGDAVIGRAYFEPGWKWSGSVKPIVKTDSCKAAHFHYQVAGKLAVRMDDGSEFISQAGDVVITPSGHDAWVLGDETVVLVDFQGMVDYATHPH